MNSYDIAVSLGTPTYPEVSSYVPESVKRLAADAETYNQEHPYELGYLCWTPEFGIAYVRVKNF